MECLDGTGVDGDCDCGRAGCPHPVSPDHGRACQYLGDTLSFHLAPRNFGFLRVAVAYRTLSETG